MDEFWNPTQQSENLQRVDKFLLTAQNRFVDTHDNTARIEGSIRRSLLILLKSEALARSVYEAVRPSGSQKSRLYGLPKMHKDGVPLRPILSMIGSAQHELAKFLSATLQPVQDLFSSNCTKDFFSFAQKMQQFTFDPDA